MTIYSACITCRVTEVAWRLADLLSPVPPGGDRLLLLTVHRATRRVPELMRLSVVS